MNRREFVALAASFAGSALFAEPYSIESSSTLKLETNGWRAAFDSTGRLKSFSDGRTELANSRLVSHSPRILYPGSGLNVCDQPFRTRRRSNTLAFDYEFSDPYKLQVTHEVELVSLASETVALKQRFLLHAEQSISARIVVQVPYSLQLPESVRRVFLPLKSGLGRRKEIRGLDNEDNYVYEFAGASPMGRNQLLAIPMVHEHSDGTDVGLTHVSDPLFTSLLRPPFGDQVGQWQWIYPESPGLPSGTQERTFFAIPHLGGPRRAMDLFYQTALADVKAGPAWLHDIALVNYDYVSEHGLGWFADIQRLAETIPQEERNKVALVLHGWYDLVGQYTFDPASQRLAQSWTALPSARSARVQALGRDSNDLGLPSLASSPGYRWNRLSVEALRPIPFSLTEMHRRIRFAKDRGFRVLLYFADGMNACDDSRLYSPDKVLHRGGWQGPDTTGQPYQQNPLHPDVRSFFRGYMQALLAEYGKEVDGFVWDETFGVPRDSPGSDTHSGYAGQAMMSLVKQLSSIVAAYPELVLLTSDDIGFSNDTGVAPYSLMAHGTFQDSHCRPEAWPYALFPNYRNIVWSCNWASVSNFQFMKFGVETFDAPVSIGNGAFGDDIGFSELTAQQARQIMALFDQRKQREMRLGWIEEEDIVGKYGDRTLRNPYNIL